MNLFKSHLFILFLVVFTELIGFGLIIPVLPQLAASFDIDHFKLGILLSAFSFAQFLASPILGLLSDRYGRKPILIISKLGTVIAYIVLAYAQTFWVFLLARLLDGFTGGNIAVARAYIADVTTEKNRAKGMAVIGVSFGLGFIFGPALGGIFYNLPQGQLISCFVAGGLSVLATLLTVLFLKEPESRKISKKQSESLASLRLIKHPVLLSLCLIYFVYMICFSGFETTFSNFTHLRFLMSVRDNSLLFMYAGVVGLVVQLFLSRKASKNFVPYIALGLTCLVIAFFGMSLGVHYVGLLVFLAILSIGISLVNTYMPALITTYTNEDTRGLIMGVYESIGSISRIIGPLIAYSVALAYIPLEYLVYGSVLAITLPVFLYVCFYYKQA